MAACGKAASKIPAASIILTPGLKYLDFGCGNGTVLKQNLAARSDLNCFGIDVKDFNEKLPEEVTFKIYDGANIPFCNDTFDIIIANHVLEHIPQPDGIISELKRVLKPDGQLFIEVPNERSLYGKPSRKYAGTIHFRDDPTHLRPYSKKSLIELFKKLGFRIIKTSISRNLLHLVL